jgi:hypothetical protein
METTMRHAPLALLLSLATAPTSALAQSNYETLHQFTDNGAGSNPTTGLTPGSHGELYGTTVMGGQRKSQDGIIFMLTPPAPPAKKWGYKTIWKLHGRDGAAIQGRLLLGQDGALYGTASAGGYDGVLFGTVFRLTPPAPGSDAWRFSLLYRFGAYDVDHDGGNPDAGLIQDASGALFGTTTISGGHHSDAFGSVFKLTPPAGGTGFWTFDRLASFGAKKTDGSSPLGTLYRDANGILYGTAAFGGTNDLGTVFTVTPPAPGQTKWVKQDIVQFASPNATPAGGLVLGPDGDLYGSTTGIEAATAGTIYRLVPPANRGAVWTEQTIFQFSGDNGEMPMGGLTADGEGGWYGTTFMGGSVGNGTLFHLLPPPSGQTVWKLQTLCDFTRPTRSTVDFQPNGDLVLDSTGTLYGTTFLDTFNFAGSVFRFVPG